MRSVVLLTQFVLVAKANAKGLTTRHSANLPDASSIEKLLGRLFSPALNVGSLGRRDLESTTHGKPSRDRSGDRGPRREDRRDRSREYRRDRGDSRDRDRDRDRSRDRDRRRSESKDRRRDGSRDGRQGQQRDRSRGGGRDHRREDAPGPTPIARDAPDLRSFMDNQPKTAVADAPAPAPGSAAGPQPEAAGPNPEEKRIVSNDPYRIPYTFAEFCGHYGQELGLAQWNRGDRVQQEQPASTQPGQPSAQAAAAATAQSDTSDISVTGDGDVPGRWAHFDQVQFPAPLITAMQKAGFTAPSPIQQYAWPILMADRDLIGIAKTGSGKTLGFLLPAFSKMLTTQMSGSPLMLVVAPTRELAVQIDSEAKKFAGQFGVVTALAYGGVPKGEQLHLIKKGSHLLVGTPGRLNDFLSVNAITLHYLKFMVLDEADRMLDMGFEPQIRSVFSKVPKQRQTMMFTATWPKEIRAIAGEFFKRPVEVRIGDADELQANKDIDQQVIIVSTDREKEAELTHVLRNMREGQAIVFTKTKKTCDGIARALSRMGVQCQAIHGDRSQQDRDIALDTFKSGRTKLLIATDVAARGLDVKAVTLVVNYDHAATAEEYVHRIGRTGRAGMKGTAITLLTRSEGRPAQQIMEVMQKTGKPIPDELRSLASSAAPARSKGRGGGGGGRSGPGGGRGGGGGYGGGQYGGGYGGSQYGQYDSHGGGQYGSYGGGQYGSQGSQGGGQYGSHGDSGRTSRWS